MGTWNLRILYELHPNGEEEYSVVEVHYDSRKRPKAWVYHKVQAPTREDLDFYISEMAEAQKRPLLTVEDFKHQDHGKEQG